MTNNTQKGSSAVVGLVIVLALAVIGFVAWQVIAKNSTETSDPYSDNVQTQEPKQKINNENDLKAAEEELENTNLDELDTSDLDTAADELL